MEFGEIWIEEHKIIMELRLEIPKIRLPAKGN